MITASFFKNVRHSVPMVADDINCFKELVEFLTTSVPEAFPDDKCEQPCVSPAAFPAGATRSKATATSWNWFAADIDNKLGNMPGATINDVIEVMDRWAYSLQARPMLVASGGASYCRCALARSLAAPKRPCLR